MNLTVIGTGFVGVVTAAVFSDFGNKVWGLDIDLQKIASLKKGKVPFFEPGLKELLQKSLKKGNLDFTTDYSKAISESDLIMIAVGTPSAPDGQADLKFVLSAAKSLAPVIKPGAIIALKSTVPPGTNITVENEIKKHTKTNFHVVSLPEFLKEGTAVHDTLNPDRIVIGATNKEVIKKLKQLHQPLGGKFIVVKPQSAQMSKYAANAYLAQRITFINQISNLCETSGADVEEVIQAMGPDKRIGTHYWYPGLGYGGSCFPKDVRELAAYSKSVGENQSLFIKIDDLNANRIPKIMDRFGQRINGWQHKKIAVLGLSFKPNTDDIREAPSLKVIPYLKKNLAQVTGYDPKAGELVKKALGELQLADSPYSAANQADAVIILIEWPELVSLDLDRLKQLMKGNILIDTRNQYNPKQVRQSGLEYIGIGR